MTFARLIGHVSKKPVPDHVQFFIVEVMATYAANGEDAEVEALCQSRHPNFHCTDPLNYSFRSLSSIATTRSRKRPRRNGIYNMMIAYRTFATLHKINAFEGSGFPSRTERVVQ